MEAARLWSFCWINPCSRSIPAWLLSHIYCCEAVLLLIVTIYQICVGRRHTLGYCLHLTCCFLMQIANWAEPRDRKMEINGLRLIKNSWKWNWNSPDGSYFPTLSGFIAVTRKVWPSHNLCLLQTPLLRHDADALSYYLPSEVCELLNHCSF